MATASVGAVDKSLSLVVKELQLPYPPKKRRRMEKKPKNNADRLSRNRARRKGIASGKAKRGDGKDVHHKDGNPQNNSYANLSIRSRKGNRSDNA